MIGQYISASNLRERVTFAGLDLDVLEFALYSLTVIGDEHEGLACSEALEALDEIERRVSAAEERKGLRPLSLVKAQEGGTDVDA